jgi:hypothetical protein
MRRHAVEVTESALDAIAEQARYIAVDAQAPLNATRWLEATWDAAHSFEHFPRRAPVTACSRPRTPASSPSAPFTSG